MVNHILAASKTSESLKAQRTFLNKLNLVLVSILKQDWPHNWPTFINEIVSSSRSDIPVAENNMTILRLLSEEVFDYSADQMTSSKTKNLKTTMCAEFSSIFQLCTEILEVTDHYNLRMATLETLLRFLNWIPLGFIFETPIIETLRRYLNVPDYRNISLKCLTEIGGLQIGPQFQYDEKLVSMFTEVLTVVSNITPVTTPFNDIYEGSHSRDQEYVQCLALFLTNFFSVHLNVSNTW